MPVPIFLIVPALLSMAGLLVIIPALTRPDLFFAVTVSPEFRRTADGLRILRRYRAIVWSSTLIAMAVTLASGMPLVAMLILAAGYLWALVSSHGRALAYAASPSTVREVDLGAPRESLPGGPIVALLPVAFLGALGGWVAGHFDRLPSRLPVHWGLHGVDGWVATTPTTVFGLLAVYASTCLLMAGIAWALLHWSRRISTSGPGAAGERQFRRRMMQLLIATEYLLVGPPALTLLAPAAPSMEMWVLVLTLVIVAFALTLFRAGQGGARATVSAGEAPAGDRTPDACWKWGLFYVNPADPSILVEKRFGIGYTVNLGNRWAWVVLVAVLVPAVLGMIFLRRAG